MKLNTLLIGAFLLVALIFGIVTYFGITITDTIEEEFNEVVERTTPAVIALGNIKSDLFLIVLETNEYILEPTEEHLREFEEAEEDIEIEILAYEQAEGEEEIEEIKEIKEGIEKIIILSEEIIKLKKDGKSQEELLIKSRELDDITEEFVEGLNEEIVKDVGELDEKHKRVGSLIGEGKTRITVIGLITVILAVLLGLFISRKISKPLGKLTKVVDEVSKGNFKVSIEKTGNINEINRLMGSLSRIMASMKLVVMNSNERDKTKKKKRQSGTAT